MKLILEKLKRANLFLDINKYQFYIQKIKYLRFLIIIDKLKINL